MKYRYWLANLIGVSSNKKIELIGKFSSAEAVYYIEETQLKQLEILKKDEISKIIKSRKEVDIEKEYNEFLKYGIGFISYDMEEYPKRLKNISSPPYALYVKGNLPDNDKISFAIVGARMCTPYGQHYALEYGRFFADNDFPVISGLARGIDCFGQRGCVDNGGKTYAVLGSGVDVCYPKANIGLYNDILENGGGIISEYPPGTQPLGKNFPARNRIISGLSDVVIVMEAKIKSGSLITADMALEQGKEVYALPGPVNSLLSEGCNRLIYQGAGILLSPKQLIEELDILATKFKTKTVKIKKQLENEEKLLYSRLTLYPKGINSLIEETGLKADVALRTLVSLQIKGMIKEVSRNYYVRT